MHSWASSSSVKVRLFADGAPTNKIVTLDSAGSWKGSFTGLDQKDASGNDIAYTVEEAVVGGHDYLAAPGAQELAGLLEAFETNGGDSYNGSH